MEKKPSQSEGGEQYSIEQFRAEIAELAARELAGGVDHGHFLAPGRESRELNPDFNVANLTEEDREIWRMIREKTITIARFQEYSNAVSALDDGNAARVTRVAFLEFAANKVPRAIFERAFKDKAS